MSILRGVHCTVWKNQIITCCFAESITCYCSSCNAGSCDERLSSLCFFKKEKNFSLLESSDSTHLASLVSFILSIQFLSEFQNKNTKKAHWMSVDWPFRWGLSLPCKGHNIRYTGLGREKKTVTVANYLHFLYFLFAVMEFEQVWSTSVNSA